jgi:uncharacterized glyoxalase superfamily protein PhnB
MSATGQRFITILVCADIAATHDFLVVTFGLVSAGLHRDADGHVVHGEVSLGDEVIWLHRVAPEFGLRSVPELGAATAMVNVFVDDVDAHHARSAAAGATILYPPTDQPYGQREYGASDSEGRLWSFATRV